MKQQQANDFHVFFFFAARMQHRGRLTSSIVASGPNMLLEFVTSPAGHLINTGFQIKADTISLETGDSKPIEVSNSVLMTFSVVCEEVTHPPTHR